jgi:hypothetical protein
MHSYDAFLEILLADKEIFEKVPQFINVNNSLFSEIEEKAGCQVGLMKDLVTNNGADNEKCIRFFPGESVTIFDGIAGSAFGRMSYIYRSKGLRMYIRDDGSFRLTTPYCTIDHDGFNYACEEVDSIERSSAVQPNDITCYLNCITENQGRAFEIKDFITILGNILRPFHKDYFIEYVLTPPDVNKLSDFSILFRKSAWEICLLDDDILKLGNDARNYLIRILIDSNIPPHPDVILEYITRLLSHDTSAVLSRLDELKSLIKGNNDIIEIKPNFCGIGIDFNALVNRFTKENK